MKSDNNNETAQQALLYSRALGRPWLALCVAISVSLGACADGEGDNNDTDTAIDVVTGDAGTDVEDDTMLDVEDDTMTDVEVDTMTDVEDDTMTDVEDDTMTDVEDDTMTDVEIDTMTDVEIDTMTDVEDDTMTDVEDDTMTDVEDDTMMDTGMDVEPDATDGETLLIFGDDYHPDVAFGEFGGSTNVLTVDDTEAMAGTASLRIDVPGGGYTGGALVTSGPVDLSEYNALTFWAKASRATVLNTVGIGNDSADNFYQLERRDLALTETWTQYTIPLMDPSVLTEVSGVFHFAEGADGDPYNIWFDDIQYSTLDEGEITAIGGNFATLSVDLSVGGTTNVVGMVGFATVGEEALTLFPQPVYYAWTSSNTDVATVNEAGVITAVATGTADISGEIGGAAAGGLITVNVGATVELAAPTVPAPTPTTPVDDLVAVLYSDAYADQEVVIDTFLTPWSGPGGVVSLTPIEIEGDAVLRYDNLDFAGVEFTGDNSLDITAATHVHFDVWTPNGSLFGFQPTDWGSDNAFGGGDDTNGQVRVTAASTPPLVTEQWVSYDIELTAFEEAGLANRANLSQLILVGRVGDDVPGEATIYLDNVYFYTRIDG